VGQWVYLGTPVSTTNKTDCYDVAEIFLKVALNTITSLWQKLSGKLAQKKIFYLIKKILCIFLPARNNFWSWAWGYWFLVQTA
jgi:hypothetical protein